MRAHNVFDQDQAGASAGGHGGHRREVSEAEAEGGEAAGGEAAREHGARGL